MNPTSAQDLVNMGFYGYQGWSDPAALADYRATGGSGKGNLTNPTAISGGGGGGQVMGATAPSGVLGQANQYLQQAATGIQKGLSDTKSRYQEILNTIKGEAGTDVATEFGRRGIPTSSGVVQQAQGRESARRSAQVLAGQSQAELPFYEMLANLGVQQANLASSSANAAGGAGGGIDWGSEFANFVNRDAQTLSTNTQRNAQGIRLNQASQPRVTTQYSPSRLSPTQQTLFSVLAPIQTGIQNLGSQFKKQVSTGLSSSPFFSALFR